jgi:hypothetical protein
MKIHYLFLLIIFFNYFICYFEVNSQKIIARTDKIQDILESYDLNTLLLKLNYYHNEIFDDTSFYKGNSNNSIHIDLADVLIKFRKLKVLYNDNYNRLPINSFYFEALLRKKIFEFNIANPQAKQSLDSCHCCSYLYIIYYFNAYLIQESLETESNYKYKAYKQILNLQKILTDYSKNYIQNTGIYYIFYFKYNITNLFLKNLKNEKEEDNKIIKEFLDNINKFHDINLTAEEIDKIYYNEENEKQNNEKLLKNKIKCFNQFLLMDFFKYREIHQKKKIDIRILKMHEKELEDKNIEIDKHNREIIQLKNNLNEHKNNKSNEIKYDIFSNSNLISLFLGAFLSILFQTYNFNSYKFFNSITKVLISKIPFLYFVIKVIINIKKILKLKLKFNQKLESLKNEEVNKNFLISCLKKDQIDIINKIEEEKQKIETEEKENSLHQIAINKFLNENNNEYTGNILKVIKNFDYSKDSPAY